MSASQSNAEKATERRQPEGRASKRFRRRVTSWKAVRFSVPVELKLA